MENGLRDDGFFDSVDGGRSSFEEVAEGVVLSAQREYEERKVRLYGRLLATIALDRDIDRGHANALIRLVDRLSYRQLMVIAVIGRRSGLDPLPLGTNQLRGDLLQEIWSLVQQGVAGPTSGGRGYWLGPDDVHTHSLGLEEMGAQLFDYMELGDPGLPDDPLFTEVADDLGWG